MISLENRSAFARAEIKARQVKPRVSMIHFGQYCVASTQPGITYTVTFSKDQEGHWQAECECAAHTKSKKAVACYHIVSAAFVHKLQANIRKEVRAALAAQATEAPVKAQPSPAAIYADLLEPMGVFFCTCGVEVAEKGLCHDCLAAQEAYIAEQEALEYDRACLFG